MKRRWAKSVALPCNAGGGRQLGGVEVGRMRDGRRAFAGSTEAHPRCWNGGRGYVDVLVAQR